MLTHKVLAKEQGYSNLASVFPNNEMFIKKEDPHIAFLVDMLEPICIAFENGDYGAMFAILGGTPAIHSHADKVEWNQSMNELLALRASGSIGSVLDHLRRTMRPRLPETVERRERENERIPADSTAIHDPSQERLRLLRQVSYQEVCALAKFIDGNTPFATKHGVKGAEFENVLAVFGRGWSQYDFNLMLEWASDPKRIPVDKYDAFERNRNLFYVVCSRPKTRLALLFTQHLSNAALCTLRNWFGPEAIRSAPLL
jgi:DNA helicase-2/ATP-dependent DNA helicase PcrA